MTIKLDRRARHPDSQLSGWPRGHLNERYRLGLIRRVR
jgi:hypothetical protein